MKGLIFGGAAVAALARSVHAASLPVDPIVVNGKHFFWKTNQTEFFVRGVAYQQDYNLDTVNSTTTNNTDTVDPPDPLADVSSCMRDIPYLLQLRTNVIRTYSVQPGNDHSGCMNAFAEAGIYVISDLSSPSNAINRDDPAWNVDLYTHYTQVVEDLSQYNNLLGFFAGNEVSNSINTTAASAFVKAAVRDTKAYIAGNVGRPIPVGYATYDGDIRDLLVEYFNCDDQTDAIDFWGYNVYSWCGQSSYVASQYQARTQFLESINIPAIFAEYGCNTVDGEIIVRPFTEVQALFGSQMTPVWSGGIVYQYFETVNKYGLVSIDGNTVSTKQDFDNLSTQMAKASPSTVAYSAVNTGTPFDCPTVGASWQAQATPLPPTPNENLCNCVGGAVNCILASGVDEDGYGDLFNFVCGSDSSLCDGIAKNATTGSYGAYGMCQPEQQLDYVVNEYYLANQNGGSSACDFGGSATLQSTSSLAPSCASLFSAAGSNGQNTVSGAVPTGSASTSSKSGAASPGLSTAIVDRGSIFLGVYVLGALAAGAGAIIL